MKGIFISLEGIEGTGKSTQARLLSEYLNGKGHRVTLTAEPGGTPISMKIRELLLSHDSSNMDPVTELLLYNAARVQHIKEIILPALEKGDIVVTDRFSDSTVAYQGFGRGISLDLINSLDMISTKGIRPDLTLLLDLDVKTGLKRNKAINKNDRLELEDIAFHQKVREGFLSMVKKEPERIKSVDCSMSIEDVQMKIVEIINRFLKTRKT